MSKKELTLQERAGIIDEDGMDAFYEMRSHLASALRAAVRAHSEHVSEINILLNKVDGTASGR